MKTDDVIRLLKKGKKIYCEVVKHYGTCFNLVYQATIYKIEVKRGNSSRVHHSIIKSLQSKGIIDAKYNLIKS